MKLLRCHVENFGKLQDVTLDFSDTVTAINEKNGWGKSTLVVFLKVMLFGFANESKRNMLENERKHYKPWQQGVYGGQLSFECRGKCYQITRTFGTREREDTFEIIDLATNLPTQDFGKKPGEELFQIDRESFEKTVYIAQNDCEAKATDAITAKIGNENQPSEDMRQYELVQNKFADYLNTMSPTRKTGAIYKKKEEIAALKAKQNQNYFLQKEIIDCEKELEKKKQQIQEWKEKQQQIHQQMEQASRKTEAKEPMQQDEKSRMFAGLILVILGFVLLFWKFWVGGVVIVIGVCIFGLKNTDNQKKPNHSEASLTEWSEAFQTAMSQMEQAMEEKEILQRRLNGLREQQEEWKQNQEALDRASFTLQQMEHRYEVAKNAKEYLTKAKENLTSKYGTSVKQRFETYYDKLVQMEQNIRYRLDANLELHVLEQGSSHDIHFLSAGYQDLVGICMRLALIDAMYQEEKPFLILDDPFANLDEEKLANALKLIQKISQEYQVIYLTCHESRLPHL